MGKILVHACCCPCSTTAIETLENIKDFKERIISQISENEYFSNEDITIFYYNPNISPKEEYDKRLNELKKFCNLKKIKVIEGEYDNNIWNELIKGFENCPEKGERCKICYEMRLKKTKEYAKNNNFEYFTTTLTSSPFKDSISVNEIGPKISEKETKFLICNFKKKDGYKRSIEISKEYNIYRQEYCGCIFSTKSSIQKN